MNVYRSTNAVGVTLLSIMFALSGCDAAYTGHAPILVVFPAGLTENEEWKIEIWDIQKVDDHRLLGEISGGDDMIPAVLLRRTIAGRQMSDGIAGRGPSAYFGDVTLILKTDGCHYAFTDTSCRCDQAASDMHLYVCYLLPEDLTRITEEEGALAQQHSKRVPQDKGSTVEQGGPSNAR